MQRVVLRRIVACARGALFSVDFVAAAIRTLSRFTAVVRRFVLVSPAREPRDLPHEIVKPVCDRDEIFADQFKIVVFEVSV